MVRKKMNFSAFNIGCVSDSEIAMQYFDADCDFFRFIYGYTDLAAVAVIMESTPFYRPLASMIAEYVGIDSEKKIKFDRIVRFVMGSVRLRGLIASGDAFIPPLSPGQLGLNLWDYIQNADADAKLITERGTVYKDGFARGMVIAHINDDDTDEDDGSLLRVNCDGSFISHSVIGGTYSNSSFVGTYFYKCDLHMGGGIDFTDAIFHNCTFGDDFDMGNLDESVYECDFEDGERLEGCYDYVARPRFAPSSW